MKKQIRTRDVKMVPIGNSKGIRLPKELLQKYAFSESVVLEEKKEGIFLHRKKDKKLSWEDTYKSMGKEKENWNDFDITLLDGLEDENVNA